MLKKLRIKPITRIVHINFNAQVTDDFFQNPLPADQQLGRQQFPGVMCNQYLQQLNALWTISSHFAKRIRKLLLRFQTKTIIWLKQWRYH